MPEKTKPKHWLSLADAALRGPGEPEILVFRTSVETSLDIEQLQPLLDALPGMKRWTLDLEDCDKVLRIVSDGLAVDMVVSVLSFAGYFCEELPE